jgi:hypothetical protein
MRVLELLDDGRRREIRALDGLAAVRAGSPVVLERGLIDIGLYASIVDAFLAEVSRAASSSAAVHLKSVGLHRLHDVLEPPHVADLLGRLDRQLATCAVPLARGVMRAVCERPPHYFVCARLFVRAQIPLPLLMPHTHLMQAGHLEGHLRPVKTHRDVDLTHPRHSLSIWCAVGRVSSGNSVALHLNGARTPVAPALDPGDILLFDADLPHASVPNHTEDTRVGVGGRMKVGRWLQYGPGTHWRPWYDASLLDTPFEPVASLQSRLTVAAFRRWRWRRQWNRRQRSH